MMAVAGTPWQFECENMEQRYGYLLTSAQWSDCTFVVGSETNQEVVMPAHKLVLAMASPVFEAMFYGGLSKHNEPIESIDDIPPDAFRDLLRYIYTGDIRIDSFSMAYYLWYGAKKYMMPQLLKKCKTYIWSVVGPTNACQTYELARLFDEETLIDKCIKIISTNTKEVLNDSSFEDVQLNTLITVCSLEHLTVDSELDLFHAVARYAEAEQRRQEQISPSADGEPPSKELSDEVLLQNAEGNSPTSPTAATETKPPTEGTSSEETADKQNLRKEKPTIHTAVQSIRFLTLSGAQFAAGPARSNLLTEGEKLAIFMNIHSTDSPVAMPTGFDECRQRRQSCNNSVDKGIFAKLLPKPSTESRCVAATKSLTPAEIVRDLSSQNQETLELAARAARHITFDGNRRSENFKQLIDHGGIRRLVTALDHPCTGVQYDAASAIANIASKHHWTLDYTGALSKLVVLLGRGGAVAEQAARALGNMASWGGYNARDAVVEAGALPALLAYMHPNTPSGPLATYVRAYRMICQNYPFGWTSSTFQLLTPAIPYISNLLQLADEQVLVEACGVLEHLAGGAEFDSELFTPTLATRLTALLQPAAAPRVQTAALDAVERMLYRTELRDRCLGAGCLDHIINFLKCGNHSHVKTAAEAIAHILDTPNNIQQALDRGILEALVPALTEGDDNCEWYASRALRRLCWYGSPSQLSELAVSAALEPYCLLLANQDGPYYSTYDKVLDGVTYLVKRIEQDTKVALLLKLREIGVPQLLIPLQQSESKSVRENAAELLRTLHNDQ